MDTQNDVWVSMSYPDPTKEVGTGCRGRDQQAMRWFGKGASFKIWPFLVSTLDFWGVMWCFQVSALLKSAKFLPTERLKGLGNWHRKGIGQIWIQELTLPETNSLPLKIGLLPPKEILQPSIFRCEVLVSGRVIIHFGSTITFQRPKWTEQWGLPLSGWTFICLSVSLPVTCALAIKGAGAPFFSQKNPSGTSSTP